MLTDDLYHNICAKNMHMSRYQDKIASTQGGWAAAEGRRPPLAKSNFVLVSTHVHVFCTNMVIEVISKHHILIIWLCACWRVPTI